MIGETLSHFRIVEKLGACGMGEVYRAENTILGREVALKALPADCTRDRDRLVRFEREAKVLATLDHPNIAAVYSFAEDQEVHFLVMQLAPGRALAIVAVAIAVWSLTRPAVRLPGVGAEPLMVPLEGGPVTALCEVEVMHGATWSADDTIIHGGAEGLYLISAQGGDPLLLTQEDADRGGEVLPRLPVQYRGVAHPGQGVVFDQNADDRSAFAPAGDKGRGRQRADRAKRVSRFFAAWIPP